MPYTIPNVLVTTDWVAQHATDAGVRVVEVDVDTDRLRSGPRAGRGRLELDDRALRHARPRHRADEEARGAAGTKRHRQQDDHRAVRRQQQLVRRVGVLAVEDLRPRRRADHGRRPEEVARRRARAEHGQAVASRRRPTRRADPTCRCARSCPRCSRRSRASRPSLVDVRSPQEFTGEILAPPGLPETCQRGGHIPGAKSIPWAKACNDDGTFKSYEELKALYGAQGVTADKPVIAYCRIGERSSHTWFVLKYLLGFQNVQELRRLLDRVGQPRRRAVEKP